MGQYLLPGNPPVEIILRRSARARRLSLRVSRLDGRVTLTRPMGVPEREAIRFAQEKAAWLRGHLAGRDAPVLAGHGAELPLEGVPHRVIPGSGRRVTAANGEISVPGPADTAPARLRAFLRTLARERLAEATLRHAAALGRPYGKLTLRDTRSRWGSCSHAGDLMYSWRLILAPPEVLDYVAAHEVAHLAQMNHSPAFWAEVARLMPEYGAPRLWLRQNGESLHRYQFG